MAVKSFEQVVQKAKASGDKNRVVIAGADCENILLGAFRAQEEGFADLVLVGETGKILPLLYKLGLQDKPYRIVETYPGDNVTQIAIELINKGEGDILMRGNVQTREFLMPLLDKRNGLRTNRLLSHIDLVSMPEYPKLIAIGDVTVTITIGEDGAIAKVEMVGDGETPALGGVAMTKLPDKMIAAQSAEVDVMTGATFTSKAAIAAAADCLAQAQ